MEDAKQEKNCIISAPTGSGKTIVALEIIRVSQIQNIMLFTQ